MDIGISYVEAALLFLFLTATIYYAKQKIESIETKIYGYLLLVSIIGCGLSIPVYYLVRDYNNFNIFTYLLPRFYLVYLAIWTYLLTCYFISLIYQVDYEIFRKRAKMFFWIYFIIISVVTVILPLEYYSQGGIVYTCGTAVKFTYLICGIQDTYIFIQIFRHYKTIRRKKLIPFISAFILGIIAVIIQAMNPSIRLMTFMIGFVTQIMYFTIENPDLKMIEQLNIARDQADKANQAKSDFLSSMSHEIRTPLNAIVGFSEALQEEQLPDKAREEVKDIVMASNSLLEIVNGILDISKIESGKIEIVNSEYNFRDIYDNLVALTKGRLGEKPLEIRTSYDESIPKVLYGDHTRVKQVILNILTNAVKYTREGYIDFRVTSLVKDDICRLIISVEDSGIGIKQENINRLFSRFERLDLDKNITIEGTGLGLAITKKLIELMHGTIVVQSVYGKGSKFTIAIDQRIIHKDVVENVNTEVVDTSKTVDVSGKHVLIVDDNKINLKVASRLLEGYNLNIETVDSGALCLEKINSGISYDLILMDDMMPGLSGVDTLHKLQEIPNFGIPVVALTANAISGMKEKYLQEGFNDYLAKPIDKEELKSIIIKYLNK